MIEQLAAQTIAGLMIGVLGGTIIIYVIGRSVATIKDKQVDRELEEIRAEHNKNIGKIQKKYDGKRSEFLSMLGKYRRKIRDMKVVDRTKAKEMYTGENGDAPQTG